MPNPMEVSIALMNMLEYGADFVTTTGPTQQASWVQVATWIEAQTVDPYPTGHRFTLTEAKIFAAQVIALYGS